ncbi:MAG: hypothetical protein CM15mP55_0710 [Hyphomicrobiales bacterium]|nr:MAG: hypothetical protein CM15mP55_0710 [Hyphomicrobiales bacterium]
MLWLLPFFTYHMAITRIRNIAEHALVPDNDDPFRNARTTKAGWLARIFLPPIGSIIMLSITSDVRSVLAIAGRAKSVKRNGFGERMETAPGYLSVLRKACARHDDEDEPGNLVHNARRRVAGNFTEGFTSNAS